MNSTIDGPTKVVLKVTNDWGMHLSSEVAKQIADTVLDYHDEVVQQAGTINAEFWADEAMRKRYLRDVRRRFFIDVADSGKIMTALPKEESWRSDKLPGMVQHMLSAPVRSA